MGKRNRVGIKGNLVQKMQDENNNNNDKKKAAENPFCDGKL